MIDRMTVDEARIINYLKDKQWLLYLELITYKKGEVNKFHKLGFHLTGLEFKIDLIYPNNMDTYINNLESMKVIESQGEHFKWDEEGYQELKDLYKEAIETTNKTCEENDMSPCSIQRRVFAVTQLGQNFIKSCTIND